MTMDTNTTATPHPQTRVRSARPVAGAELTALFGEYAGLAQHPGEEDERLALAIRVFEALRLNGLNEARPA
jgi:hypothetical protein